MYPIYFFEQLVTHFELWQEKSRSFNKKYLLILIKREIQESQEDGKTKKFMKTNCEDHGQFLISYLNVYIFRQFLFKFYLNLRGNGLILFYLDKIMVELINIVKNSMYLVRWSQRKC